MSFPERATAATQTVGSILAQSHDRSMARCDRMLGPITDPDATFFQRWGAVRFVSEQLQERYLLEQELLDLLRPVLAPELRGRLQLQADRVWRLRQDIERLGTGHHTARELAHATRELIEALRLWYAEMEFGLGDVELGDIGSRAERILRQLNYRTVESLAGRGLA